MGHRNMAHVFSFALKGSDEQEASEVLYGNRTGEYCKEIYLSGGQSGYCDEYCAVRLLGSLPGAARRGRLLQYRWICR